MSASRAGKSQVWIWPSVDKRSLCERRLHGDVVLEMLSAFERSRHAPKNGEYRECDTGDPGMFSEEEPCCSCHRVALDSAGHAGGCLSDLDPDQYSRSHYLPFPNPIHHRGAKLARVYILELIHNTRTCGLVAMTSASHAEGRQLEPGQV